MLHDEGIVKVSGEVGSGKTMLCRMLMERLPAEVATIYLATPSFAREEILQAIADDLELKLSERRTVALRELQEHLITLYGAGRRVVILIDEAHVMPEDTLEQVRLLSNLESSRHKLLQIVLFGQPELDATLAKPSLRQLRDRITHSFRMRPLPTAEVVKYLDFRMRAAGYRGPQVFAPRAGRMLANASGGLTRRINILADKALLAAYSETSHAVTNRHVKAAIADSEFAASSRPRTLRPALLIALAAALGLAAGAGIQWLLNEPQAPVVPVQAAAPKPMPPMLRPAANSEELETELDLQEEADAITAADAESQPPQPLMTPNQRRRLQAYATGGQKLLSERIAATRNLLDRAPDESYAIELFITENPEPARMERFLIRARDMVPLSDVYLIPMGAGSQRMRVIYGSFESAKDAQEAERRLPPKYQQAFRTAPRSFAELRKQM
ncbi:MAG: AAA family ATPase [Betaproteobacteria bacterium]|nr:AAA family ATPase [Betaproteobacteria bacterium]MBV9360932.1 AAA family ATPase [Betaproteobacteria bacterium]